MISTYRRLAVREGYLVESAPAIAHQLAAKFFFRAGLTTVITGNKVFKR